MGLYEVYLTRVKGSGRVMHSLSMNGSSPQIFMRDPIFTKLEHDVFGKINEIFQQEEAPKLPDYKSNNLRALSVEDAIKELILIENGEFPS